MVRCDLTVLGDATSVVHGVTEREHPVLPVAVQCHHGHKVVPRLEVRHHGLGL